MPARGDSKPPWLVLAPAIFLILWSGGFAVAKVGVTYAEPLTLLALRYGIVLLLMLPLFAIMQPELPRRSSEWVHLLIVGFLIQCVYFGLSYIAFKAGVSAGGVAIIVCLQPILVGLIAPHLAGEKVGALRWIGLGLGLMGAATVILARTEIAAGSLFGVICAVGALIGITAGTLWEKRFGLNHHPVVSNGVQFAAGLIGTLPLAMATETMQVEWTAPFVAALAYLVIGNSLISMTLLLAMIRMGEVSKVSSLFYLVPPMSALFAWPLLGEAMTLVAWGGMALAAVGVAIASRKPVEPKARRVFDAPRKGQGEPR